MRKGYMIFAMILLAVFMYGCSNEDEDAAARNETTVTIGATPWTSTEFPTEVAKSVLEDMGYDVEIKEGDLGVIFTGLAEGDIDMFLDYWDPQFREYLDEYSDSIEKVSTSYDGAERGLVVPKYMKDVNDVGDLKGKEDEIDNEVLGIEESDPAMEEVPEVLDAYDLDVETINATEAAMLSDAKSKIEKKEPVVLFGWRPHSMFDMLDVKLLTNEKTPDLNTPSTVYTVANDNLQKDNPKAYKFLKNWSMSLEAVEYAIKKVEKEDDNPQDLAQEWIDENQDKVDDMMDVNEQE